MNQNEIRGQLVAEALAACPVLGQPSDTWHALWFAIQQTICTHGLCLVTPLGSHSLIPVTADHVTEELLAAIEWLNAHESQAREMSPKALFVKLRGVATRGADGSARAAQADALHGMTEVSPGDPIIFTDIDDLEVAS